VELLLLGGHGQRSGCECCGAGDRGREQERGRDWAEAAHEWTLFDIRAQFADVVTLAETLEYLRGLSENRDGKTGK
jgi:hypothetical protein